MQGNAVHSSRQSTLREMGYTQENRVHLGRHGPLGEM